MDSSPFFYWHRWWSTGEGRIETHHQWRARSDRLQTHARQDPCRICCMTIGSCGCFDPYNYSLRQQGIWKRCLIFFCKAFLPWNCCFCGLSVFQSFDERLRKWHWTSCHSTDSDKIEKGFNKALFGGPVFKLCHNWMDLSPTSSKFTSNNKWDWDFNLIWWTLGFNLIRFLTITWLRLGSGFKRNP